MQGARTHTSLGCLVQFLLFKLAVVSVLSYLMLKGGAALHWIPHEWSTNLSGTFTFLGSDFERFAAISQVTAGMLANVEALRA
ncbi:hypothetical protein ASD76_11030 [Altererythrobacter sp. Root672]|nr:hypothetical protein ASD76_11030 [Altererythrobacter sp. Root672]